MSNTRTNDDSQRYGRDYTPPPSSSRPSRRSRGADMITHTGGTPPGEDEWERRSATGITRSNTQANAQQYRRQPARITDDRDRERDRNGRDRRTVEFESENDRNRRRSIGEIGRDREIDTERGTMVIRPAQTRDTNRRDRSQRRDERSHSRRRDDPPSTRESQGSRTRRESSRGPYYYRVDGRGERQRRYEREGTRETRTSDRTNDGGGRRRSSGPRSPRARSRGHDHERERRRSGRRQRSPSRSLMERITDRISGGVDKVLGKSSD